MLQLAECSHSSNCQAVVMQLSGSHLFRKIQWSIIFKSRPLYTKHLKCDSLLQDTYSVPDLLNENLALNSESVMLTSLCIGHTYINNSKYGRIPTK